MGKAKKGRRFFAFVRGVIRGALLLAALGLLALTIAFSYVYFSTDYAADDALFAGARTGRTTRFYYHDDGRKAGSLIEKLADVAYEGTDTGLLPSGYAAREWEGQSVYTGTDSVWVPIEEIPDGLQNAFIAIEDHRFYEHGGVDWLRTAKAAANYIFHFDNRFGGSTITQQLIKNLSSEDELTISRKLREMCRALHAEQRYSKEEILELYLNIAPFSGGCVGVGAASARYFGKKPAELTTAECASIAAVTNSPGRYDPVSHPENNLARRNLILAQMYRYGYLTQQAAETAQNETLCVAESAGVRGTVNNWYIETVMRDVIQDLEEKKGFSHAAAVSLLYQGGLSVYTMADVRVQTFLDAYFSDTAHFPAAVSDGLQFAMTVVDPTSGALLGVAGGVGDKRQNRILNYATDTRRAPGSALKPLSVYAPALEEGVITWASVFDDVPVRFIRVGKETVGWPHNTPATYSGLTDIPTAVKYSKNTVAVRVLEALGITRSYAYLTEKLGLSGLVARRTTEDGRVLTDLSEAPLALGQLTDGVSVTELTAAYGALANGGVFCRPRSYLLVTDATGEILLDNRAEDVRVFRDTTAAIMTEMLRGVVEEGTAKILTLGKTVDVAGKTGTSGDGRDKWFVGYTPYAVAGIWCGFPDGGQSVTDGAHLGVWDEVMKYLHDEVWMESGEEGRAFRMPAGVTRCVYCRDSGELPTDVCRIDPRGDRTAVGWFETGRTPHTLCTCHEAVWYHRDGVARPDCPIEEQTRVGLIRVSDRDFPIPLYVTDAQYVYRAPAPAGSEEKETPDGGAPFFADTIPSGRYIGISYTEDGRQFNAYCTCQPEGETEEDFFRKWLRFFGLAGP